MILRITNRCSVTSKLNTSLMWSAISFYVGDKRLLIILKWCLREQGLHQVNLEHLSRVVFTKEENGTAYAYPDTCVGTDSHTPMVNGLGVVAWGVGGIEAEAAMLGQPISMLIPRVVGFKLTGSLPEGTTATDLVLTITERLRQHRVVGKFVEFRS